MVADGRRRRRLTEKACAARVVLRAVRERGRCRRPLAPLLVSLQLFRQLAYFLMAKGLRYRCGVDTGLHIVMMA